MLMPTPVPFLRDIDWPAAAQIPWIAIGSNLLKGCFEDGLELPAAGLRMSWHLVLRDRREAKQRD